MFTKNYQTLNTLKIIPRLYNYFKICHRCINWCSRQMFNKKNSKLSFPIFLNKNFLTMFRCPYWTIIMGLDSNSVCVFLFWLFHILSVTQGPFLAIYGMGLAKYLKTVFWPFFSDREVNSLAMIPLLLILRNVLWNTKKNTLFFFFFNVR